MGTRLSVDGAHPWFKIFRPNPIGLPHDSREMSPESNHPQLQLLPWYLSGTLGIVERRQVTSHLADCELCRSELESLTLMRRIVRQSFAEPGPGIAHRTVAAGTGVLACVIALQLGLIIHLWPTRPVAALAGIPDPPRQGTALRLLPNPDASVRIIDEFLRGLGARIVDGPDGEGSYVVLIPTADPGTVAETVAVLESHPEVVARITSPP